MKWFKHDTDASMDNKMQSLMLDYGAEGYGLYWYCIELIAQNINESNLTFELEHDSRIIARNLGLTSEKTIQMMKYMVSLGLFDVSDSNRIICGALAKRIDKSMTSNVKMREIINTMRVNSEDYSGFVYFVMAHNTYESKIKIGRSKNPTSRLGELKRRKDTQGYELKLIHKIKSDDAVTLETALHRRFKHINIDNEWFEHCEELIEFIESISDDTSCLRHDVISLDKIREDKIREDKNIKPFSFTLTQKKSIENTSNEYKNKLKEYIEESKKPMSYNFFYEYCVQKDYKYKNFKMAYDNWNKDSDTKQTQTKKLKVI